MRAVIVASAALLVCALAWIGYTQGRDLLAHTPSVASAAAIDAPMPTPIQVNTAPPATLAPAPTPSPSYNYVWDPNNPNQCFDPHDPQLPANAPRCPPRAVPPDPGGPIIVCPSGYALVYPNNQPECLPTKPTH